MNIEIEEGPDGETVIRTPGQVDPRVLLKLGMTEVNRRRFARLAPAAFGFIPDIEKKDDFMRLGEALRKETYEHGDSDRVASEKLIEWAGRQAPEFLDFFNVTQNHLVWFAAARWADQAFPVVTMGEKFCAALMATQIPEDMLEEVECPWKAFVIEVPGKVLSVFDPEAMVRTRVVRILVHKTDHPGEPWRWIAFGEKGQHVWRTGFPDQLLKPVEFKDRHHKAFYQHGDEAFEGDLHRDERLYVIISRLVLNTCMVVADPDQVRQVGSSHKRHANAEGRRHGPPEQRVFQVGRPINLDCREAIQEYIEGERAARDLKIQSLVRGYWRRQPHGPKMAFRRRQWIEPYWRGPEDAPILVRPHVVPEE